MHNDGPDEAVFKNISRCSYPPHINKIKLQRANYPGQQVFYCTYPSETRNSSASLTCIVETAWEHIEDLDRARSFTTLSRWELSRPLNLWVAPFSELCCNQNPEYNRISKDFADYFIRSGEINNDAIQFLGFISEIFCRKVEKGKAYKITSAFFNYLLSVEKAKGMNLDGLLYPSANTLGAGINLVLKKELVDDGTLICSNVVMYAIERDPGNLTHLRINDISNAASPDQNGNFGFKYVR
jgi:hypothetical protein